MSKQILNVPAKIAKGLSKGVKGAANAAMQPATPGGTWQFVLGAILGAPVSSVYSFLYNSTIGRIPIPPAINLGAKILLPLVPIYFVKKSKVAFGNVINGALVGVMVAQILNIGFGLLAGKMPSLSNGKMKAEDLELEDVGWFQKLM